MPEAKIIAGNSFLQFSTAFSASLSLTFNFCSCSQATLATAKLCSAIVRYRFTGTTIRAALSDAGAEK